MPKFLPKHRHDVRDAGADAAEPHRLGGPEVLQDRGLLAEWYVLYRLQEEVERSRRAGHLLSIAIFSPMLLDGEDIPWEKVFAGTSAAKSTARSTDFVGWIDGPNIIAVLPDVDEIGASAAIRRWQNEMWLKSTSVGGMKWRASSVSDLAQFETAHDAVQAAIDILSQAV